MTKNNDVVEIKIGETVYLDIDNRIAKYSGDTWQPIERTRKSIDLTTFGAGWRVRLGSWLIRLGESLVQSGGR